MELLLGTALLISCQGTPGAREADAPKEQGLDESGRPQQTAAGFCQDLETHAADSPDKRRARASAHLVTRTLWKADCWKDGRGSDDAKRCEAEAPTNLDCAAFARLTESATSLSLSFDANKERELSGEQGDPMPDLTPLLYATRLEKLAIFAYDMPEGTQVSLKPLSTLGVLPALRDLDLTFQNSHRNSTTWTPPVAGSLHDLEALGDLPQLTSLSIGRADLDQAEADKLATFTRLQTLALSAITGAQSFAFIRNLDQLVNLSVDSANLTEGSFLEQHSKLETLGLTGGKVTDWSFLRPLHLRKLRVDSNCSGESWTDAPACETKLGTADESFLPKTLEELSLADAAVSDLRDLADLPELRSLDIGFNAGITNLEPLRGLPKLAKVEASFLRGLTADALLVLAGSPLRFLQAKGSGADRSICTRIGLDPDETCNIDWSIFVGNLDVAD